MTQSHHHNKLKKKTPLSQNAGHKSRLSEELLKPQMHGEEGRGEAATADDELHHCFFICLIIIIIDCPQSFP